MHSPHLSKHPSIQNIPEIISFGAEIRKKVIGDIYATIEEILIEKQPLESLHTVHVLISSILLHLHILNIRESAKLSLKNTPHNYHHD